MIEVDKNRVRVLWLCGALLAGCSGPSSEALPKEGSFTALTYNVHGLPPTLTGDDTVARMVDIAPRLDTFDLVGLQEDFDDTNHAILEAGTDHPTKVRFAELLTYDRFYGSGLAVFARAEANLIHHEHYDDCNGFLEASSDCLASKGFQVIRLQLGPDPDHTLDVYNTHMEAGGGAEDAAARAGQIDQLLVAMEQVSPDRAVLFLGDTNLHSDDPEELQEITRLRDDAALTELCLAVACPEPGRIDRVLYRSSESLTLTGLEWWVAEDFVGGEGVPLSDHDPIAGRFAWVAH